MAFDVTQSVAELQASFTNWLAGIFGDESKALAFAQDPYGELDDAGFTNQNLANLNVQQAVSAACTAPGVPSYVQDNLQDYTPAYQGPPTIEHVVEQVQQVTQIVYQDNDVINQEIQQNNTNIEVGDDFEGDIDVDNLNVGDGGAGNTGDDFEGNLNSGDGAVQVGEDADVNAPIVTGNDNITADGDIENAVAGRNNQVGVQNSGDGDVEDNALGFGSGDVSQANDNDLDDSALAVGGGDALNVSDSTLEGVGISTGSGDSEGTFQQDNSTDNSQNFTSNIEDSEQVNVQQAGDDTEGDQDNTQEEGLEA